MDIKILDGNIKVSEYNPSFLKSADGKVIAVSFPIESFLELTEDVEDYAYVEGRQDGLKEKKVSHKEVMEEFKITPERVKKIRKELGLTQDQFGEKLGYSGGTIRNIETKQQKITPRLKKAISQL